MKELNNKNFIIKNKETIKEYVSNMFVCIVAIFIVSVLVII